MRMNSPRRRPSLEPAMTVLLEMAAAQDGWFEIGTVDAIPRLGAKKFRIGGETVAVFRTSDDEIFALIDRCPHRGGPLSEGIVAGRTVACPLHGIVIALNSGEAVAPDEGCTRAVPVKQVGHRLYLAEIG